MREVGGAGIKVWRWYGMSVKYCGFGDVDFVLDIIDYIVFGIVLFI